MRRAVDSGLVALALRRTLSLGTCVWIVAFGLLVVITVSAGTSNALSTGVDVEAGLARQSLWTAFLLGVAPLLVLRAANHVAPWRHADAPWLATRAVSNTTIAVSTWIGASVASVALVALCAGATELRGASVLTPPVLRASFALPREHVVTASAPLSWSATLDETIDNQDESARIELGLGPGAGTACAVQLLARDRNTGLGATTVARIGNRGAIEVPLQRGGVAFDFELATTDSEARVYVLSERGELWSRDASTHAASLAILARLALAMPVWIAIALALSSLVSGTTAAFGVLALWTPLWLSSGTLDPRIARGVPGADLFDALAIVGDGRAPGPPALESALISIAIVALGLGACAVALRAWRVSR